MPELPEVETVVAGLTSVLISQRLSGITFNRRRLRDEIPCESFIEFFENEPILNIGRRGKYIILESGKGFGIIHLGMTGVIAIESSDGDFPPHTHFYAQIAQTGKRLRFSDPRRFGRMGAVKQIQDCHWLRDLGPEPLLGQDLSQHLQKMGSARKIPIKNFLMDSKVVVGVGNIYACEVLFDSKISPHRTCQSLSASDWVNVSKSIRKILSRAIQAGGTTIRDFRTSGGEIGYFANKLKVYGLRGPCSKCGTLICQTRQAGRSTWYCEHCQI